MFNNVNFVIIPHLEFLDIIKVLKAKIAETED